MKKILVIGNTGFIGSYVQKKVENSKLDFVGVSSKYVEIINSQERQRQERRSADLNLEISEFLTKDTIVINTAWIANQRENRNNNSHMEWAKQEILLIESVISSGARYVSLGSIAEVNDQNISPSYGTIYSDAKIKILRYLYSSYEHFLWIRIASAFGQTDTREWLLTELLKYGKKINIRNPNSLMNLSDVDNVATQILSTAMSNRSGALNFWSDQWISAENILKCFIERQKPQIIPCKSKYFSEYDPEGFKIDSTSILEFFKSHESQLKV